MKVYYNDNDPQAVEWIKQLIVSGAIPDGFVDDRSIERVTPSDLDGFTQCHFFAGIGGWTFALKLAGWDEERTVWTGSCPCQPFTAIGSRRGVSDERHLWPEWFNLINAVRPGMVFGEQVASRDGMLWLDHVLTDLQGANYTIGAYDICASGFGAPHIRQRLYYSAERMGDASVKRLEGLTGDVAQCNEVEREGQTSSRPLVKTGKVSHAWSDCQWLQCSDGFRPTESGTLPMVDGSAADMVRSGGCGTPDIKNTQEARQMRLHGYGNTIVIPVAEKFIKAHM